MSRYGEEYTNKELADLEKQLKRIYDQGNEEMQDHITAYLNRFKKTQEKLKKDLNDGTISETEYRRRIRDEIFSGKRWAQEKEDLAEILYETNKKAVKNANDRMDEIYRAGYNGASFEIEKHYLRDVGLTYLTAKAFQKLKDDKKISVPYKSVSKSVDMGWNLKRIQNEVNHAVTGIKDLTAIGSRAVKLVTNTAHTGTLTSMQYLLMGVQDWADWEAMRSAERLGIEIHKEWIATLDKHTRDLHRDLDGQEREVNEPFEIDEYEIMYPREPSAPAEMIVNCRCRMKKIYPKYRDIEGKRRENIKEPERKIIPSMTYREWEEWKNGG